MYDWLLFLHVLMAFFLVGTVVIFSAFALGAPAEPPLLSIANVLWAIGGLGTLVLGIWLALYVDGYEIWDGWILGAIGLWAVATELGRRAQVGYGTITADPGEGGAGAPAARQAALMHWLRSVAVLGLLVVMIYKPGA